MEDVKSEKKSMLDSDDVFATETIASPEMLPIKFPPSRTDTADTEESDLDSVEPLKKIESRQNTGNEVAAAPDALGIFNSFSVSLNESSKVFGSSRSSFAKAPERKSSLADAIGLNQRQDSFSLYTASSELVIENLRGAKVCV